MSIATAFSHLRATRANLIKLVDSHSLEQINKIPEGLNNNLIWNLAHCLVTQQLLCYKLSGLPMHVSNEMVEQYRKGSRPNGDVDAAFVKSVKEQLITSIDQMESDYKAGLFKGYKEYPTSFGVTLSSSEEAIFFNNAHESMHLGTMLAMKNLL